MFGYILTHAVYFVEYFRQNVLVYAYPNGGMTNNLTRHSHSGRANGAFLDGHVDGKTVAELLNEYGFEQAFGGQ